MADATGLTVSVFREVFENTSVGMAVILSESSVDFDFLDTEEFEILDLNPAMISILQLKSRDMIKQSLKKIADSIRWSGFNEQLNQEFIWFYQPAYRWLKLKIIPLDARMVLIQLINLAPSLIHQLPADILPNPVDFNLCNELERLLKNYRDNYSEGYFVEPLLLIAPDIPPILNGHRDLLKNVLASLIEFSVNCLNPEEMVLRAGLKSDLEDEVILRFEVINYRTMFSSLKIHGPQLALSGLLLKLAGWEVDFQGKEDGSLSLGFNSNLKKQLSSSDSNREGNLQTRPIKPTKIRVLVVEDNLTNQVVTVSFLRKLGYQADVAENGREGLEMLTRTSYQLVLMDCQMPEMDGFEATRLIRSGKAGSENQNIPIIAVTANVFEGYREKCLAVGMNDYLAKPLVPSELARSMEYWLNQPGQQSAVDSEISILVVEDSASDRLAVSKIINNLGYQAETAEDGRTALDCLTSRTFELIFMDINLPDYNGYQLTKMIRNGQAGEKNTAAVIIALTAAALQEDRERCLSSGMNDYIAKPVLPLELSIIMDLWLKSSRTSSVSVVSVEDSFESNQIFDPQALLNRLMGDKETAIKVIEMFLTETPMKLNRLKVAVENGDLSAVRVQAHSIKGSAATLGGLELSALAAEIEDYAKNNDLTGINPRVSKLINSYQNLTELLKEL